MPPERHTTIFQQRNSNAARDASGVEEAVLEFGRYLQRAKPTENIEFELRFSNKSSENGEKLKQLIGKLLPALANGSTVKQWVDFIRDNGDTKTNYICQVLFIDGVMQRHNCTYRRKRQIMRAPCGTGRSVVVSSEQRQNPFKDLDKARIKLRLSIPITMPSGKKWRIDVTLSRMIEKANTKNGQDDMKSACAEMFPEKTPTPTPEQFVALAPWGAAKSFELEAEYADESVLEYKDVMEIDEYISDLLDPTASSMDTYTRRIVQVAKVLYGARRQYQYKKGRGRYGGRNKPHHPKLTVEDFASGNRKVRDLYNRVKNLTHESWRHICANPRDWIVFSKAHGDRSFIILEDGVITALSNKITEYPLPRGVGNLYIADSEYVNGIYYVFDVLVFDGVYIVERPAAERIDHIARFVAIAGAITAVKEYMVLGDAPANVIHTMSDNKRFPYPVDGLVFTNMNGRYVGGESYKFKPPEQLTIDFLVKAPPRPEMFVSPDSTIPLYLFCSVGKGQNQSLRLKCLPEYDEIFPGNLHEKGLFPTHFSPPNNTYAYIWHAPNDVAERAVNNICEFKYSEQDKWQMVRVRDDYAIELAGGSYFGNNYLTAYEIWGMIQNPLLYDHLVGADEDRQGEPYFREEKREHHVAAAGFNSFVKDAIISKFSGAPLVVDLMAGRGADLFRLNRNHVQKAIFVDMDSSAIKELIDRKSKHEQNHRWIKMGVNTVIANLKDPARKVLSQIKCNGEVEADMVMCNFGIHYLLATPETLRNFVKIVSGLMKTGGNFVFTSFDGQAVHDLLNEPGNNGHWIARETQDGKVKFAIRRKYKSAAMELTGQEIEVLLPFSGDSYYPEYLVNFEYVINIFREGGFKLNVQNSFAHLMPKYDEEERSRVQGKPRVPLTAIDRTWVSLYRYAILEKM